MFGVLGVISAPLLWIYLRKAEILRKKSTRERTTASVKLEGDNILSLEAAEVLSSLIVSKSSIQLKQKALVTLVHSAAVFQNHDVLREAGCIRALSSFVQSYASADFEIWQQKSAEFQLIETGLTAINNLATNESNLSHLQDCIRSVLFLASGNCDCLPDSVRSASLKVLINLSCTDNCFEFFMDTDVQNLIEMTKLQTPADLRLHSLKLLANLSWSDRTASFILAATLPDSFSIDENCSEDILLRWLTIMKNISTKLSSMEEAVNRRQSLSVGKLTVVDLLCGDRRDCLRTQLLKLINHRDDNISSLAVYLSQNIFKYPKIQH